MNPEDIWLDIKKEDDEAGMEDTLEEDQKDDLDDSECVEHINGDRSILAEAYRAIDEAGPEGLSAHLLGKKLGTKKLSTRAIIKNIDRRNIVDVFMKDDGRNKTSFYVAKRFQNESAKWQNVPTINERNRPVGTPSRQHTITERQLTRINYVMEMVEQSVIVDDPVKIYTYITTKEAEEGLTTKCDRKSLKRIFDKLSDTGKIKIIRTNIDIGTRSKEYTFICRSDITENHSMVKSAIDKVKGKLEFVAPKVEEMKFDVIQDALRGLTPLDTIDASLAEMKHITNSPMKVRYTKTSNYQNYKPKFVRAREFHSFLFYLTRDYDGQECSKDVLIEDAKRQGISVTPEVEIELASIKIYQNDINWKTFINPLPKHSKYGQGWILLCDAILRLPLSIFTQQVMINYDVPGLDTYLNHPIRRHYLVKYLPDDMRKLLLHSRKYISTAYEIIKKLCYMGLTQLSANNYKQLEQAFVYVNTKSSLFDTRSSAKGYNLVEQKVYPKLIYEFQSIHELEKYWHDLYNCAMTTFLGHRSDQAGQEIVVEDMNKKEVLIATLKGRTSDEVEEYDTFDIPGDQRGAAGLDSSMFSHLKRNWSWVSRGLTKGSLTKKDNLEEDIADPPAAKKAKFSVSNDLVKKKGAKRKLPDDEEDDVETSITGIPFKSVKPSKKTRIIKAIPKVSKKPYYDEVDQEALKYMTKLRVEWTKEEDTILLISKVAGSYLCQNSIAVANSMVPYVIVRDALHKKYPILSRNKTSRACQRRINYMLRNPTTFSNVNLFLAEIKQDPIVLRKFPIPERGEISRDENEKRMKRDFPPLLEVLVKKFKRKFHSDGDLEKIPDDIDELKRRFWIKIPENHLQSERFEEPLEVEDVRQMVICSVILSSLCCKKDKYNWAFHLFKIYQQYPDQLLRKSLTKLRSSKMVSMEKNAKSKKIGEQTTLPLGANPYQLSVTFLHKFLTRFQSGLIGSVNKFTQKIKDLSLVEVPFGSDGGAAAVLTSLAALGLVQFKIEIPEQVVVIDPNVLEHNDKLAHMMEKYKDMHNDNSIVQMNELVKSVKKDTKKPKNPGMKSKKPDNNDDEDIVFNVEPPEKGTIMAIRSASRWALYSMREDPKDSLESQQLQHAQDYFVVSSCKVWMKLLQEFPLENNFLPEPLVMWNNSLEENDLNPGAKKVFEFVDQKSVLGATCKDMINTFQNVDILEDLLELIQKNFIFRVGVVRTRFVSKNNLKPWVLRSFDLKRRHHDAMTSEDVKFASKNYEDTKTNAVSEGIDKIDWNKVDMIDIHIRPWIKINGHLNKKILDQLLISLLNFCMTNPGATLTKIANHIQPALQPFHTRELIEMLDKLECISMSKFQKKSKPSLFSSPNTPALKLIQASILDEADDIFIDPCSEGMVKLSQFITTNYTSWAFDCPCHTS